MEMHHHLGGRDTRNASDVATSHETYEAFVKMSDSDDAADHPGLALIGRWHDVTTGQGVAICESVDLLSV